MEIIYEKDLIQQDNIQRARILKNIAKGLIKYGGTHEQDKNSRN